MSLPGPEPKVRFCTTPDGARLAYAEVGTGPPLVLVPGWVSHLELDWPRLREPLTRLVRSFRVIRYDKRGTGLSDRQLTDFSLEARLEDFATLVQHLGLTRFSLHAWSSGGPIAMSYAARFPDQVDRLILSGSFARGEGIAGKRETTGALASLVRAEWGLASAAFTELFIPGASSQEREALALTQRQSAEPETAARLLEAAAAIDVTSLLPRITAPTLVIHARGDRAAPFEFGREVAAGIPGARLLALETDRHLLSPAEELQVWTTIREFLLDLESSSPAPEASPSAPDGRALPAGLTEREVEVLRLIALGQTNQQIAKQLSISLNTVTHHVGNIFAKVRADNRTQAAGFAHRHHLV